ncbi:MAG TPA: hypothetical protein VKE74_30895, partial [Gemmataceae bacterium]|nr:hypothetical protein [Gemmataceae bacterium]
GWVAAMKTVFKGDRLILMPENAAEAAALARWRDGRDGHCLTLLPPSGPGATFQFVKLPEAGVKEKDGRTMNAEQTGSEQDQS